MLPAVASHRTLLPTLCAVCRGWSNERVCAACRARFAAPVERCLRCALRVPAGTTHCGACIAAPPPQDRTLAAVDYAHPWDRLIARFKFHGALDLAQPFAQAVLRAWRASGLAPPDLVVPVPLSAARLRERGYNQAWEMARRVARSLGCPAEARLLLRIRDTPHQLALPVEQRRANVQGAFALEPRDAAKLRGRRVAVVDDVMTTGATAAEVARMLQRAGASQVMLSVFARTPAPGD